MQAQPPTLLSCGGILGLALIILVAPMAGSSSALTSPGAPALLRIASPQGASLSYVRATLFLRNGTLLPGNVPAKAQSFPTGGAYDSRNGHLYVTDFGSDNVSVVDPATAYVVRDVPVDTGPAGAVFDPDNGYLYVAEGYFLGSVRGPGLIDVLDGATNTLVAKFNPGNYPIGMAYDHADRLLWVATYGGSSGSLVAYNTTTDVAVTSASVFGTLDGLAYDPVNDTLYAPQSYTIGILQGAAVGVYNASTGATVTSVPMGPSPSGAAFDPVNGDVYAVSAANDNVTVIEAATNRVIANVSVSAQVPDHPFAIAAEPVTGDVYVANEFGPNVSVIDGATNTAATVVAVGGGPTAIAVDGAGDVFVINGALDNVTVLSARTRTAVYSVPIATEPFAALADPVDGKVFVACGRPAGIVAIANLSGTFTLTWISVPLAPAALTFDPATDSVFVVGDSSATNGTLARIDGGTDRVVASSTITGHANAIAFDRDHNQFFVARDAAFGSPELWVYNATTMAVVKTFVTFPVGLAFDPANGEVYLSNPNANRVEIYASTNDSLVGEVPVFQPADIEYDPGNGDLYVSTQANVSVIDGVTNRLAGGIPLAAGVRHVGIDASRGLLYVASDVSNNVTVVRSSTLQTLAVVPVGDGPEGVAVDGIGAAYVADASEGSVSILEASALVGPTPPNVSSVAASSIGETSATLEGNLGTLGDASSVAVGFLWSTNADLSSGTNVSVGPQASAGVFTKALSGLSPGTTYHFEAWGSSATGFVHGSILNFTTTGAGGGNAFFGLPPLIGYGTLVLTVVIAGVVVIVLLRRRKKAEPARPQTPSRPGD